MPVEPRELFPEEMAAAVLDIVGGTDGLLAELPGVDFSITTVRRMLGNYGAVNDAIAVWNEHAVAHIVQSQTLIKDTLPLLDAYWDGPAYRAYRTYALDIIDRIGAVQSNLEQVGAALTNILDTIVGQYQAAVDSLTTLASALIGLAGSYNRIPDGSLMAALEAVQAFLQEVSAFVAQALGSMNEQRQTINEVANAQATMQIPSPVTIVAPVVEQPEAWRLRPDVADAQ